MDSRSLGPKAEATRQAIIDVAVHRFGRDGFRATSIAAIARDAGVSRSLAYAYFDDAEELFGAAVNQDAAALIGDVLAPLLAEELGDLRWRETMVHDLLAALERFPLARRVLAGLEPEVTGQLMSLPILEELRGRLGDLLEAGQHVGLVRPEVDPPQLGRAIVNLWLVALLAAVQFGADAIDVELASLRALVESAVIQAPSD